MNVYNHHATEVLCLWNYTMCVLYCWIHRFRSGGCVRMIKAPQQKSMNLCLGSKDMIVMWKVPS